MTIKDAIKILEHHNKWRRDKTGKLEMVSPNILGNAIDVAVDVLKKME